METALRQLEQELSEAEATARGLVTEAAFTGLAHQAHKWAGDIGQIRYEIRNRLRALAQK